MLYRSSPVQLVTRAVLGLAALLVLSFAPAGGVASKAEAARVTVEFRTALDPYGHWRRHSRWGEVWVPARVDRHWRPYTVGHWVYSDDYGWYWVADRREARWGWVVYHYGRWVLDPELGWVWVPGDEWAPAWVSWRRGHHHIGWAPLPPDRLIVRYRDDPDVWIFVQGRRFTAPLIANVVVPLDRRRAYLGQTVVVNRTVAVAGGGATFAVNPGIAPTIVSAVVGQPLRTYQVRPRVLAGTSSVPNAVTVQASELKQQKVQAAEATVQETKTTIQPAKSVPEPKALADNENGRLGDNPPKAAKQAAEQKQGPDSTGKAAAEKQATESGGKSAGQKQGEKSEGKSAEQKQGEKSEGKSAEQKQGDESKSKSAEQKQGAESKSKSAEQKQGDESKARSAEQKQGDEAKGKSARQKQGGEEPAAKKSADRKKAEQSKAKSADQKPQGEPARKSAGQKRQHPDAAAQKQGQPHPRQARQPASPKKPETAGQAPAPAQKSAPAPKAHPDKAQGKQKPGH